MKKSNLVLNSSTEHFAHIFFCQKITKPNCTWRKAAKSTFIRRNVDEIDIFSLGVIGNRYWAIKSTKMFVC